jgi:hypothetical protein
MAATLFLFAVTRTTVTLWRPRFMTPVVKEIAFYQTIPQDALGIELYWVDSTRQRVPTDRIDQIMQQVQQLFQETATSAGFGAGQPKPQSASHLTQIAGYLHDHGYQHLAVYQPADRFWSFQLIEAIIFFGLAAALIAISLWLLQRRAA